MLPEHPAGKLLEAKRQGWTALTVSLPLSARYPTVKISNGVNNGTIEEQI